MAVRKGSLVAIRGAINTNSLLMRSHRDSNWRLDVVLDSRSHLYQSRSALHFFYCSGQSELDTRGSNRTNKTLLTSPAWRKRSTKLPLKQVYVCDWILKIIKLYICIKQDVAASEGLAVPWTNRCRTLLGKMISGCRRWTPRCWKLSNAWSFLGGKAVHFRETSNETIFHLWHILRHINTKIHYNV